MRVNPHGSDWTATKDYAAAQIAAHTAELEDLLVEPRRADHLRGMIFALKAMIEHVEPTPMPIIKDVNYG